MFKTLSFYRLEQFQMPEAQSLEQALASGGFLPCSPTQAESSGWVAPRGRKSLALGERLGLHLLLQLCTERRPLPASAVKAAVEARIEQFKEETGRERVGGKLKKQIRDEVVMDLLPRAFSKSGNTLVWLDSERQMLVLSTTSSAVSDKAISLLMDALTQLPGGGASLIVKPVQTQLSPATCMAQWLSSQQAPAGFSLDQDCELKTPDERKSSVRYARHTLELDEIGQHITEGKLPTQLGMTWNGRVSFVLTDKGQLKKIQMLDVVMDGVNSEGEDGFDADMAISTTELSQLITDLMAALGGELGSPTPHAEPGGSARTAPWDAAVA